jgi:hypothetical protein
MSFIQDVQNYQLGFFLGLLHIKKGKPPGSNRNRLFYLLTNQDEAKPEVEPLAGASRRK